MFAKKVWIPILIVLLAVIGGVLFYSQKTANQKPVTIIMPAEVEQPTAEKPPPPGETHETGHWHGDVWHSVVNEPITAPEAEQSTPPTENTEVQGAPVGAQPPTPMQDSSRTQTLQEKAEIQRQWREWREWHDKLHEIAAEKKQVNQELTDALVLTEDKRYETDENYKREVDRKIDEASEKTAQSYARSKEHRKTEPPIPPTP